MDEPSSLEIAVDLDGFLGDVNFSQKNGYFSLSSNRRTRVSTLKKVLKKS